MNPLFELLSCLRNGKFELPLQEVFSETTRRCSVLNEESNLNLRISGFSTFPESSFWCLSSSSSILILSSSTLFESSYESRNAVLLRNLSSFENSTCEFC